MNNAKPHRNNQLAMIHIAKKELGLDDDTYRAVISQASNGRTNSAGDLDYAERNKLLEHLKGRGWKNKAPKPQQTRALATDDQSRKIRALWLELKELGGIENSSEAALAAFVKRLTNVNALQWLSTAQASMVIESLKKWVSRVDKADKMSQLKDEYAQR